MRYKLAIFDMDGTILNTIEDLTDAVNYALAKFNMPLRTIEEVKFCVGNGLHKTVERAVPEGTSPELVEKIYEIFVPYYQAHSEVKTAPYPGVVELLKTLKSNGVKTAVVSNKRNDTVQALAYKYFPDLFDVAIGEKEGLNPKPAPDAVNLVLSTLRIHKDDAVYIGDSNVDVQTAENSKMDVIAVDWGFRSRAFLADLGVDSIVSSAYEIEKLILTDLSAVKMVYCSACGAEFMDNRDRCPACGMIYEPAAERIYMDKLQGIRDDVDNLGLIPGQETVKEIKKTGKKVTIILISILLVAGVLFGIFYLVSNYQNIRYEAQLQRNNVWAGETFPRWDEMYDNGEYEALVEEYIEAGKEKYQVWNYQHSDFLSILSDIQSADFYYESYKNGAHNDSVCTLLLDYYFHITCREDRRHKLTEKELEYVAEDRAIAVERLQEIFHMTPDEEWELLAVNPDDSNDYLSWDKLKAYVKEHRDEFG